MLISLVLLSGITIAHDEGHGPKLTDTPKQGGKVAPVISASDASKGEKAELIYKAELVRIEGDVVKVYLYDKEMKTLTEAQFSKIGKTAMAIVEHVKKRQKSKESIGKPLSYFLSDNPNGPVTIPPNQNY